MVQGDPNIQHLARSTTVSSRGPIHLTHADPIKHQDLLPGRCHTGCQNHTETNLCAENLESPDFSLIGLI